MASTPIQSALLAYLQATRANEWSGDSAANGNDPATVAALAHLQQIVRSEAVRPGLGTPPSTELFAALDALAGDRRARLAAASHELPGLYIITLSLSGIALLANAGAVTMRSKRRAALLVGSLAVVVGMSVALLFALGTPWRGVIVVGGHPIDTVISNLQTGYFGT